MTNVVSKGFTWQTVRLAEIYRSLIQVSRIELTVKYRKIGLEWGLLLCMTSSLSKYLYVFPLSFVLHIRLECHSVPSPWRNPPVRRFLQVDSPIGAQIPDTRSGGYDWSRSSFRCSDVIMWFFLFSCGGPFCSECVRPTAEPRGLQIWI